MKNLKKYIVIKKEGTLEKHTFYGIDLVVDNQKFNFAYIASSLEDARWYKKQLVTALKKIVSLE